MKKTGHTTSLRNRSVPLYKSPVLLRERVQMGCGSERLRSLPSRHPLAQGIALALALATGSAHAVVFNVTTNSDSGLGSLRQAVPAG